MEPEPTGPAIFPEPASVKKFSLEEGLTRDSFMDFYIGSHVGSMGSFGAQVVTLEWWGCQGVDFMTMARQCLDAGGWDALTGEERQRFVNAFNAISAHGSKRGGEKLEGGSIFNDNLTRIIKEPMDVFRAELREELAGKTYDQMVERRSEQVLKYQAFRDFREDFL